LNDFPKEEFISRIEKIQIHIEKENIDAVIITSPSNFRNFTGLDSNFRESPTRPGYLIISKKNPIKAIIPSIGITAMQETLVKDIETGESPNPKEEGISLLKKNIRSPPKSPNMGIE
jgi:Xaa-Pro aminopeptidase